VGIDMNNDMTNGIMYRSLLYRNRVSVKCEVGGVKSCPVKGNWWVLRYLNKPRDLSRKGSDASHTASTFKQASHLPTHTYWDLPGHQTLVGRHIFFGFIFFSF